MLLWCAPSYTNNTIAYHTVRSLKWGLLYDAPDSLTRRHSGPQCVHALDACAAFVVF